MIHLPGERDLNALDTPTLELVIQSVDLQAETLRTELSTLELVRAALEKVLSTRD